MELELESIQVELKPKTSKKEETSCCVCHPLWLSLFSFKNIKFILKGKKSTNRTKRRRQQQGQQRRRRRRQRQT